MVTDYIQPSYSIDRSIRPLYVRLVDRDSAEGLRQNRERLSTDITDLINEYAPKVFNDFDRKLKTFGLVYFAHTGAFSVCSENQEVYANLKYVFLSFCQL